jgi:hypothetical protein
LNLLLLLLLVFFFFSLCLSISDPNCSFFFVNFRFVLGWARLDWNKNTCSYGDERFGQASLLRLWEWFFWFVDVLVVFGVVETILFFF